MSTEKMEPVLEIERSLIADVSGEFRRDTAQRLTAMAERLRLQLRAQSTPARFRQLVDALKAVEAAQRIMGRYG